MKCRKKLRHLLGPRMAMHLPGRVKLDAVARREQHDFALWKMFLKSLERRSALGRIERQLLAHFQRRGGVIQSQQKQPLHYTAPSGRCMENGKWQMANGKKVL